MIVGSSAIDTFYCGDMDISELSSSPLYEKGWSFFSGVTSKLIPLSNFGFTSVGRSLYSYGMNVA
jgi:hypothetical protein